MKPMQIDWTSFEFYNQNTRGKSLNFEDLCRQLFVNENLSGNKQFKYLHSNPNNTGLETEPIYDEINRRWIGFQAKYFESNVDYNQIFKSAELIVKNYCTKVDHVFLFCNKPLKSSAKGFVATVKLLQSADITVELVTDNAILDLIREKYPQLAVYYFGSHTIKDEWFQNHTRYMFDELGERYNRNFNVNTLFSEELSLFVHDKCAADYLNGKKTKLLEEINELYHKSDVARLYLMTLEHTVSMLPDVDNETLYQAIKWKQIVEADIRTYLTSFSEEISDLNKERKEQYTLAYETSDDEEKSIAARKKYHEIENSIHKIEMLLYLPQIIRVTEREQQLLYGNVLAISGRAGTGKSQLVANETKTLMDNSRAALLLVAGIFFTSEPIYVQIIKNLRFNYDIENLIDILESIGERDNCIVPIFIDALNETWNYHLWKTGIPLIIDKVKRSPMVKLVITFRSEYKELLLSDSVNQSIQNGEIICMYHRGFENNSLSAVQEFLNHYNIPFTPLEYFGFEMTNPLFLTLYCKTYNGEEVSLPVLYERLLDNANRKVYKALETELHTKGYTENDDLIRPFIIEIASYLFLNNIRLIPKNDLFELKFWSHYGLVPASFIKQIVKENILHNTVVEKEERYYFAYDQMNDYYCARAMVNTIAGKEALRKYLTENVLGIKDGELGYSWNIDLFVNACALYAEKYGEECIDIIGLLADTDNKWSIFSSYIGSFQWRNSKYIPVNCFKKLLNTYPCTPSDVWQLFIGNSVKVYSPLNADYLHNMLLSYELSRRDYLWTIYINKFTNDNSDRVVQLIEMYNRGEKLEFTNEKQTELLLTLFSWFLTSSNRWLRDCTSKAMIEILKEHFQLCLTMLKKFKDVNDPYVIQRIYGIIFGACCKREKTNKEQFKILAEYIYNTVFNQTIVYPDILLRDYARLIIEKFLVENHEYNGVIKHTKIIPPYKSEPIPEIADQHYLEQEFHGSMFWVMHSMRFEGMGMYGDFGRYIFQCALRSFEVDEKKIFNYAIYYILNTLHYSEQFFGEHDKHCGSYDRFNNTKTERIGKKYQWITMFNILARVSDYNKMIDRWGYPERCYIRYEGAWDPFVRDFDPTLNRNFMRCSCAPIFKEFEDFIVDTVAENARVDILDGDQLKVWLETEGVFFRGVKDTLLLKDENGTVWVKIAAHHDTGRKDIDVKRLFIWSWTYAYFITPEQKEVLLERAKRCLCAITDEIMPYNQTYEIYNREYPWAPSCKVFKKSAWVDTVLKTSRKHNSDIVKSSVRNKFRKNGKVLHATSVILWEAEYDVSKEEAISCIVPCAEIVENLHLFQMDIDGFFYDEDGKLAAYDINFTQEKNCFVIRKDLLDRFLELSGLELVWYVRCEKEIHGPDRSIVKRSEWAASFSYEKDSIYGEWCRVKR